MVVESLGSFVAPHKFLLVFEGKRFLFTGLLFC